MTIAIAAATLIRRVHAVQKTIPGHHPRVVHLEVHFGTAAVRDVVRTGAARVRRDLFGRRRLVLTHAGRLMAGEAPYNTRIIAQPRKARTP